MADPARYDIDPMLKEGPVFSEPVLHVERSASGQWVKWADFVDYKAGQRRNKSEATAQRLGLECVELRVRIEDLEAEVRALKDKLNKR